MESMTGPEILQLAVLMESLIVKQNRELGALIVAHEKQRTAMDAEHDEQRTSMEAGAVRQAKVYAAKRNASQLEEMLDARQG